MIKRYLILNENYNRCGYVPKSRAFEKAKVKDYGLLTKGSTDYCYIRYDGGSQLSRYDERAKKWATLIFPKEAV
jgi:hypothetical protein